MSRPSIVSLAASAIIGGACFLATSNNASAYSSSGIAIWQPGVYRGGALRGAYYRGAYYRGGYYRDGAPGVALSAALLEHIMRHGVDIILTDPATNRP